MPTSFTMTLELEKETKNTVRYKETSQSTHDQDSRAHVFYLLKDTIEEVFKSPPSTIFVTIEADS